VLPDAREAFQPALTDAERWIVGQLNALRVPAGAPALKISTR